MAGSFNMIRVSSATLTGTTTYELSGLRVTYAMGDIGSAECRLALGSRIGRSYGGAASFSLGPDAWRTTWTIKVNAGSGSKTVFKGLLMGMREEKMPSVTGTRMVVVLCFSGLAAKLRNINSTSYRSWGAINSFTKEGGAVPGGAIQVKGAIFDKLWQELMSNAAGKDITKAPDDMGGFILDSFGAAHQFTTELPEATEIIKEVVERDKPAKLASVIKEKRTSIEKDIQDEFLQMIVDAYGSMDMLEAIKSMAQSFYLNMIPRSDGKVRLLPVLAWLKKEDFSLSANEVVGCTHTSAFDNKYTHADHVAVAYPPEPEPSDFAENYAIYPKDLTTKPGKAKIITLPPWLTLRMADFHDMELNKDAGVGGRTFNKNEGNSSRRTEYNKQVGELVAKASFAATCGAQEAFDVFVVWNKLDYLDKVGYIVRMPQLHNPNAESQAYYGMVAGVTLTMDLTPQSGRCSLGLTVVSARTPDVNDELALDEHPIYE